MQQPDKDPAVRQYRPKPEVQEPSSVPAAKIVELGGRKDGTEPTRFGDWEKQGRCVDF